jgi:hypothetical protein
MDKTKYIINCNGKKTIFNSEKQYEIFKQKNQNYSFIEKERSEENFIIKRDIIKIDMIENHPIPQPNPDEPTNKEIKKMLTDFIKEQRKFNNNQLQFNNEQREFKKKHEKFNKEQKK